MKVEKDLLKINAENAEEICSRIREESSEEAEKLLGKAHKERERVLSEASREAGARTRAILLTAEKEVAQLRERIFSTVTIEKRRISLEARSLFIADIIAAVKRRAEGFRATADYINFLKGSILEGIKVVDGERPQVFYSHLDEGIISRISDLPVEFKKSDFDDIGVMVQSPDGRLLFDNRFSARLKRAYDEIYMKLLKEDF